jgi:hypothetical protein
MREWIFNARAAQGWKGSGTPSELAPAPQGFRLGLGPSGLRVLVLRVLRVNVLKHGPKPKAKPKSRGGAELGPRPSPAQPSLAQPSPAQPGPVQPRAASR